MRNSREAAAENRQKIVAVAARMFRSRGVAGVGVADIMKSAGMTHGGFYKHFASKDALVVEACAYALAETATRLRERAEGTKPGEELKAIVDFYLSERHRDNPGAGCALAALGGEIGRTKGSAHNALADGRARLVSLVARFWNGPEPEANASALVSAMVGAMIMARVADDDDKALRAARRELHRRIDAAKHRRKRPH